MEKLLAIYQLLTGPESTQYWICLFMISEALGSIEKIKASSIYQLVANALKFVKEKVLRIGAPS